MLDISKYRLSISLHTCIYSPFLHIKVGFLIALDKRNHRHNAGTNEFPDLPQAFAYVFIQDEEAFFKNPEMRALDEEIGDLDAFIKDTESMIVSELEEDILDCETDLRRTFGGLAELDCILSFASCAADLNYVRPQMFDANHGKKTTANNRNDRAVNGDGDGTETNGIDDAADGIFIENGRHPLQELIIDGDFISNDTNMGKSRINVVTGPNFSGKSCYTRQVIEISHHS